MTNRESTLFGNRAKTHIEKLDSAMSLFLHSLENDRRQSGQPRVAQSVASALHGEHRMVHHADVLTRESSSYRLRGRGVDGLPIVTLTTDDKG